MAKKNEMLEGEYARSALKLGLKLEVKFGTNPYKFGMVGSTDAHTGLVSIEEGNFFGKTTPQEPSPHRMTATFLNNPKAGVKIASSASGKYADRIQIGCIRRKTLHYTTISYIA